MEFKQAARTLNYHRAMLGDSERVERYREAILTAVREGDVVLDIGTGSGLLAFFACEAGASRVYAVEGGNAIEIARRLLDANGVADRVTLLHEASWEVELPEQVDVVVTETLWNLGIGEGMLRITCDARERLLKDGGRMVPESITLMSAPVEYPPAYRFVEDWGPGPVDGFDLSAMRPLAANNVHPVVIPPEALVAAAQPLARVRTLEADGPDVSGDAGFVTDRDATVHGLGGWFQAELAPGVTLSNPPGGAAHSWGQALLPLERPLEVPGGTRLRARLRTTGGDDAWSWALGVDDGGRPPRLSHSTAFGFPPPAR